MKSSLATALSRNPFALLGVSTRDGRGRIIEQAEEQALHGDPAQCQKARSDLVNPRLRLAAETSWLPGVAPRMASSLINALAADPFGVSLQRGLPELARANLMSAALELSEAEDHDAATFADFMRMLGEAVDRFDPSGVQRDVNEDRAIAGFPEIRDIEVIEEDLELLRKHYKGVLKDSLDRMPSEKLIETITLLVERSTKSGTRAAPRLVDDLIDSYAVETQGFLAREQKNIEVLIENAMTSAVSNGSLVKPTLDKLEKVARNWDRVAQPIQLSMMARGMTHHQSQSLAYSLRSLSIDLFNKHDLLEHSQRVNTLLRELFAELSDVSERLAEDAQALQNLKKKAGEAEQRDAEWRQAITFSAEVGLVLKDELSISPAGISWKGQSFPLESIKQVRWGAVRHSINGIPTGTDYTIAFGDGRTASVVSLRREATYTRFIGCLWRGVCVRLMFEMTNALKAGQTLQIGTIAVNDDGVILTKRKVFGSDEVMRLGWNQVSIVSYNGTVMLTSTKDAKFNGAASYMNDWNAHILEHLVRGAFKESAGTLSKYLAD